MEEDPKVKKERPCPWMGVLTEKNLNNASGRRHRDTSTVQSARLENGNITLAAVHVKS